MATDRYSDDHKIVVGGGSGTLTVDATLAVGDISLSNISSEGDINIESTGGDINLTTSSGVVSINDFDISKVGDSIYMVYPHEIYWHSDYPANSWYFDKNTTFFFKEDTTYYNLSVSTNNLYLSSRDDVYIRAGIDIADSTLWLSANNNSSPYIRLKKDTDTIDIVADTINITQTAKTNTVVVPGSAFTILESYSGSGDDDNNAELGTGDVFNHTVNGNIKWSMDTTSLSDDVYGHVFAPLPDSIPDGSTITGISVSLDRSGDTNLLVTTWYMRSYKFSDATDKEWYNYFNNSGTGHIVNTSTIINNIPGDLSTSFIIDRNNYAYSIKVKFKLDYGGSRCNIFLTGFKITYTTTKFDPNI